MKTEININDITKAVSKSLNKRVIMTHRKENGLDTMRLFIIDDDKNKEKEKLKPIFELQSTSDVMKEFVSKCITESFKPKE